MRHDELKKNVAAVSARLNQVKDDLAATGMQIVVIISPPGMCVDDKPGQHAHTLLSTDSIQTVFSMCYLILDKLKIQQNAAG